MLKRIPFLILFLAVALFRLAIANSARADADPYRPQENESMKGEGEKRIETISIEVAGFQPQGLEIGELLDLATLKKDFRENLRLYLKNPAKEPLVVSNIYIEGEDIGELIKKGKDIPFNVTKFGIVRWFDIVPNPILPGEWGMVEIRFGDIGMVGENISLKLVSKDGLSLEKKMKLISEPAVNFSSYSFNQRLDKLYLYLKGHKSAKLGKILINGKDLTPQTLIKNIEVEDAIISFLTIPFSEPMPEGDYKVIKVVTDKGSNACSIRVIKPFFPISIWRVFHDYPENSAGPPPEEWIRDCAEHLFNNVGPYNMWVVELIDTLAKYDIHLLYSAESALAGQVDSHPYLLAWFLCDEPTNYPDWVHPAKSVEELLKPFRKYGPHKPILHLNCGPQSAYPEYDYADIRELDLYPIGVETSKSDVIMIETEMDNFSSVVQPKPLWFTVQAFRGKEGRFPTPEEERLMVYMACAHRAKGIDYFCYNFDFFEPVFGVGLTKEPEAIALWDEIRKINLELSLISLFLLKGEVVPLVETNQQQVESVSMVCGEDTIIVFLINHDYKILEAGATFNIVKDIQVKVKLPEWFKPQEVFAISYYGPQEFDYGQEGRRLVFSVGELSVSQVILISSKKGLMQKMGKEGEELFLRWLTPCDKMKEVPTIDGDLGEWVAMTPIILDKPLGEETRKGAGDLGARVWLGWDDKNFYFAAKVQDDILENRYAKNLSDKDGSLKMVFDTLNDCIRIDLTQPEAEPGYDKNDYVYSFDVTEESPQSWYSTAPDRGGLRTHIRLAVKIEGNYSLYEIAVPFDNLTPLLPKRGVRFGFNFHIRHGDAKKGQERDWGFTQGLAPRDMAGFKHFVLTEHHKTRLTK